ncbi:DUF2493 domain-containing protein [Paracoccus bogoriensis]|uniref:DUF2493 domain-containing protein n=1 Tax=Paracoccus bogoriensis TaxID=242065 RepID=UPI001C677474|nr:DUF2493 domain-containing protein [Paracoccus bogoriensis]MBW7056103.1 DUF2493 domain-containing protein [Paracoccus bogoriensis]
MRLLVAGGRHLNDVALIHHALDRVHARHPLAVLIHGGHAFLGIAAEDWARDRDVHVLRYPANWRLHGKRAEGIRNAFMLADSRPDMVLALPGGEDTRVLVMAASARGLVVLDPRGQRLTDHDGAPCRTLARPEPEPA